MIKKLQISLLSLLLLMAMTFNVLAEDQDIIPLDKLDIGSEVYLLMDRETKTVLAEKDSQVLVHPASITKALTVITAIDLMDPVDLNEKIIIDEAVYNGIDPEASIVSFHIGEEVTLEDILQGIMLASGADATRALSFHLNGDVENLAVAMNEKAEEIGMKNSKFVNTSGLDDDNHLSTAYDLALLIDYALENEVFRSIYESRTHTTSKTPQHPEGIELQDLNLKYADSLKENYITGAKSGYTDGAQRALSSLGSYDGKELILITILNRSLNTRKGPIQDAKVIYNRVFNDYKEITAINKKTVFDTLEIENALDYEYQMDEDVNVYIPKELHVNDLDIDIKDKPLDLIAPVDEEVTMGILEVSYNDKIIHRETIRSQAAIPIKFTIVILDFFKTFAIILALALSIVSFFLLVYRALARRRQRRRY